MKKDKNNKTFSERFEELCKNSILEIEDYENDKNNIKQFFISELKSINDEIEDVIKLLAKIENIEDLNLNSLGEVESLQIRGFLGAIEIIKKRI